MSAGGALERVLDGLGPASGAVVMGTGIVSIALSLDGRETLSRVLLVPDAIVWIVLGVLLPVRARRDRARFRGDIRTPAAFTAVAGSAVLGTRLTMLGWTWAGGALLVVALAIWLGLLGPVLAHWAVPTIGVSFILTVGTESLALLATVLAHATGTRWLLAAALGPFALGLAFYLFVLRSFDGRQLLLGRGDHWVTGGALAISTVVAGRIALAAEPVGLLAGAVGVLDAIALALWIATMLWLPVLLAAEVRSPRLTYGVRRWSTVFPVGMYAACSFIVGEAVGAGAITDFARVWVWVAVAVWLIVASGLARRAAALLAGHGAPPAASAPDDARR